MVDAKPFAAFSLDHFSQLDVRRHDRRLSAVPFPVSDAIEYHVVGRQLARETQAKVVRPQARERPKRPVKKKIDFEPLAGFLAELREDHGDPIGIGVFLGRVSGTAVSVGGADQIRAVHAKQPAHLSLF